MLPSTDLEVFHGFLKDTYGLLAGPSSQFCFLQAFVRFTSVHVPSLGFLLLVPSFLLWTRLDLLCESMNGLWGSTGDGGERHLEKHSDQPIASQWKGAEPESEPSFLFGCKLLLR